MNNSRAKIFIYTHSLSLGGAEKVTMHLAKYFSDQGLNVSIITNKISQKEYPVDSDLKRISLSSKTESINKFTVSKRMYRYLNSENPDLLLVMGTPLLSYLLLPLIQSKTKIIISERNSPENFSGRKVTKIISNALFKFADGYVFQTNGAAKYYNWIKSNKIIIPNPILVKKIPNPIDNEQKKPLIVSVGRLNKQKNQEMLIKSFSRIAQKHPMVDLIIYGEGSERTSLEKLIKNLKLTSRVFLPGTTKDILNTIKSASLFAFSSNYEGMPNALIEAMCMGLPVISTNCPSGGPKDLIDNGVNGILIPVGNEDKFAEKLDYILSNKTVADNLGIEALKIRKVLNADIIAKKWLEFCMTIISN